MENPAGPLPAFSIIMHDSASSVGVGDMLGVGVNDAEGVTVGVKVLTSQ